MAENLWAISIDPDEAMREYLLLQLKVRAMRDLLFRSRIFNYLAAATPGLRELVTIGKIWEVALPDRKVKKGREYDLVIVDAPATGHGVAFLQTPRTFANVARVGPIKAQAEALETFLVNHRKTGVAIVALPEEMPVNETASLEQTLTEEVGVVGRPRLHERALSGALLEGGGRAPGGHLANGNGALRARLPCGASARRRRAAAQREQLARLAELVERAGQDASVPVRARAGRGRDPRAVGGGRLMAGVGELLDGKRVCICAGSGGVGKTTSSAAIAAGHGRPRQEGRGADDRPGQAARRLARPARAGKRGAPGRPEALRRAPASIPSGGELWAMMLDAKATFDELVRRTPPTPRRATGSSPTASTSSSPTRWRALRSTWRWRSSSSSTPRTATTCSCSTRRQAATRSTSSRRPGA